MRQRTDRFSDRADLTAFLGAFCFFLSAVEYMLPKPLPFMRLGIANLPILLAVDILPFRWYLALAVVKVIGMSLISGTLFSYIALFSMAGTMAAALTMWGLRRAGGRFISQIGVSIIGAMVSNASQIFIARYLVFRETAWLIAPLFLAMGLATGAGLGIFAERFARISKWYAMATSLPPPGREAAPEKRKGRNPLKFSLFPRHGTEGRHERKEKVAVMRAARKKKAETFFAPGSLAFAGMIAMLAFLFAEGLGAKAIMLCLFAFAAWTMGKRFSLVTTLSVSLGIIAANLLVPSGLILAELWGFRITKGALIEGIGKALTFEGLMYLSKATIMPGLKLPGRLGRIVATAFTYYDKVIEYKGKIRASSLALDSDDMMLLVWESGEGRGGDSGSEASVTAVAAVGGSAVPSSCAVRGGADTRRRGLTILALAVTATWALTIFIR
jgi:heptaprenyl diphosphate synthase